MTKSEFITNYINTHARSKEEHSRLEIEAEHKWKMYLKRYGTAKIKG